mgnify:CR=1 FL=1
MEEDKYFKEVLENFLHEVDQLNTIIKYSAELISKSSKGKFNKPVIEHHSSVILENSYLLATQYDMVNYLLNPELVTIEKKGKRNIFGKFQKARISFKRLMKSKKLKISILGQVESLIEAYPVIDTLPIILLDNAIKYSPKESEIEIEFSESPKYVNIIITNDGPCLELEEIEKVFERGYRGKEAELTDIPGKGFGLSFLKDICKIHEATVKLKLSDNCYVLNDIEYSTFSIEMDFPKTLSE